MKFITAFVALIAAPLAVNGAVIESRDLETRQTTVSSQPPPLTNRAWIVSSLQYLNTYRSKHGAVPYQWSAALATYSANASNQCSMTHTHGPYSENIYWTSANQLDFTLATKQAIDAWMAEQPYYTDANNPNSSALHYTALMWKNSKRIGCGWSTACGTGGKYLFCEMDPQGNVLTQFAANVQN